MSIIRSPRPGSRKAEELVLVPAESVHMRPGVSRRTRENSGCHTS